MDKAKESAAFLIKLVMLLDKKERTKEEQKLVDKFFKKTYLIVKLLTDKAGQLVSYDELIRETDLASKNSLRVYIKALKKQGLPIVTVERKGFLWEVDRNA
jgi:DNA-binding winged helix-turn-helix (wHTH) protein